MIFKGDFTRWALLLVAVIKVAVGSQIAEEAANDTEHGIATAAVADVACNGPSAGAAESEKPPLKEAPCTPHAFLRAAERGDLNTVKRCVEAGININHVDSGGYTALLISFMYNKPDVALYLINSDAGADLEAPDVRGNRPLHLAVLKKQSKILQALIDKDVDVNAINRAGETPLHLAASTNDPESLCILLDRGANLHQMSRSHQTPVNYAVSHGSTDVLEIFLNAPDSGLVYTFAERPINALFFAMENNMQRAAGELLSEKRDLLESTDSSGNTALHLAAAQSNVEMVTFLLHKNAQIFAENDAGYTPLELLKLKFGDFSEMAPANQKIQFDLLLAEFFLNLHHFSIPPAFVAIRKRHEHTAMMMLTTIDENRSQFPDDQFPTEFCEIIANTLGDPSVALPIASAVPHSTSSEETFDEA